VLVGAWPALFCALPIERLLKVRKLTNHVLVKPWQFLNSRPVFNELKKMICYFSGPSRVLELFVPAGGGAWFQRPKPAGRRRSQEGEEHRLHHTNRLKLGNRTVTGP
jgi:hypothetical protein